MEGDAQVGGRPPRRRHRGRRGGGGGSKDYTRAAMSKSGEQASGGGGSARKRGTRKNRRGRGGGAAGSSASSIVDVSPPTSSRTSLESDTTPRAEIKVVVRRLPPRMAGEQFFEDAGPRGASLAVWRSYHEGSVGGAPASKRAALFTRHSTAYLAFASIAHAAALFDALNGHRYLDPKTGVEYVARVERAMFQVVPRTAYYASKKLSALHGTIEADPHYQRFLHDFRMERQHAEPTATALRVKGKGAQPVTLTKLMEDVRARRKERDERKTPKPAARSARRRGRRGAPPPSKALLLKKPPLDKPKQKGGRASRAPSAKRNTGDGVYVMHVAGERKAQSSPAPPRSAHSSPRTPRRKGRPRGTPEPPVARPPIRLLRKDPPSAASISNGSTGNSSVQGYANGT